MIIFWLTLGNQDDLVEMWQENVFFFFKKKLKCNWSIESGNNSEFRESSSSESISAPSGR